ncbi:MAG: MFS transporter [Rhodospirillaceae bacterium]
MAETPQPHSPWAPLKRPLFRALWLATLVSNIGTWMHEVGAGWLMVTLDSTPVMVAFVQAATALPAFFLALPAGALADILDRRRYLLATQTWMLGCAALLTLITYAGWIDAWSLLGFTFALACGAAMMTPAWAATVPELVPRSELHSAIALNSTGVNVARAVGPAVAGVLVAAAGPAIAFLLNALSFLGVIVVLLRWKRVAQPSDMPPEGFFGAMRAGVRYVRAAPKLQFVMIRALVFFLFGSAIWSLLPLVARSTGGGAQMYGVLLGCIGAGAVSAALTLPKLRSRWSRDRLVRSASALLAMAMVLSAVARTPIVLVPAMLLTGVAWLSVLSTLHVSAQTAVPAWVRARALAVYLVMFSLGMTGGSVLWGAIASRWSVAIALIAAAAGSLVAILATRRYTLGGQETADTADAIKWPAPETHGDIAPERGPVLVTVEYRVAPENSAAFTDAMQELRRIRRRDGAMLWGLFHDASDPERYLETFLVESWVEHMRQHHRATAGDQAVNDRVRAYHIGNDAPRVSHLVATELA